MAAAQGNAMSKRRKFVADGVFYAELNEFFQRELAEEGYSGVEVRVTPTVTDISTQTFDCFLSKLTDLLAQSFVPRILKRSWASRVAEFANSLL